MQYILVIGFVLYLLSGHGCQMPGSRGTAKQPGYHGGNETPYTMQRADQPGYYGGNETPYTMQRGDDAARQRSNEQAKTAYWNQYWQQAAMDRVNHQKAVRDQFRQQEIDAEYKARQMLIDKVLQEFQKSLKGWSGTNSDSRKGW